MRIVHSVGLGCLVAVAACGGGIDDGFRLPSGTPVILISIDTLRADRLPAYGYTSVATPAIDRLARDGIVWERAYTHSPLTLPAHASLFTGQLPSVHGVRDNLGYRIDPGHGPTWAGLLQSHGYATGAAVSSFVLRRGTGIELGFDHYDDGIAFDPSAALGGLQREGDLTLARALAWMDGAASRPVFLFLHLYEPHAPYAPPAPIAARYGATYDGEVVAADSVLGRLFAALDARGLYERAMILLVSDHGEGLGDHGEDEHGVFLYSSTLHVPLIIKLPGARASGSRTSQPVQLVDLYPTIAALLGIPLPPRGMPGAPLLPLAANDAPERPIYAETFYPRLHFGWSELTSLIMGRHHLIQGPRPELFDVVADPAERVDLSARQSQVLTDLAGRLQDYTSELAPPDEVDDETRRRLASLGYVAWSVGGADLAVDPKDRVEVLRELARAGRYFADGDMTGAIPLLRAVLGREPAIVDAWEQLGRGLEVLGDPQGALEAFREAQRHVARPELFAPRLAELELRLGRPERAAEEARLAIDVDPALAWAMLAEIALLRGDREGAVSYAQQGYALRDARPRPAYVWAEVLLAQGRPEEALRVLDQLRLVEVGTSSALPPRGLSFRRGKVLADLGDAARSEAAFLEEIERYPDATEAYTHLAVLYAVTGRPGEGIAMIERLLDRPRAPAGRHEAVKALRAMGQPARAAQLESAEVPRHATSR